MQVGKRVKDLQRIDLLQMRWLDRWSTCYYGGHFVSGVGTGWQRGYCRYLVRFCWVGSPLVVKGF